MGYPTWQKIQVSGMWIYTRRNPPHKTGQVYQILLQVLQEVFLHQDTLARYQGYAQRSPPRALLLGHRWKVRYLKAYSLPEGYWRTQRDPRQQPDHLYLLQQVLKCLWIWCKVYLRQRVSKQTRLPLGCRLLETWLSHYSSCKDRIISIVGGLLLLLSDH